MEIYTNDIAFYFFALTTLAVSIRFSRLLKNIVLKFVQ